MPTAGTTPARGSAWSSCEACGRWPAIATRLRSGRWPASLVRLRSPGGSVIYRPLKATRPLALCKACGLEALRQIQDAPEVGIASQHLMAPYAHAQNRKWRSLLIHLPDPVQPGVPIAVHSDPVDVPNLEVVLVRPPRTGEPERTSARPRTAPDDSEPPELDLG